MLFLHQEDPIRKPECFGSNRIRIRNLINLIVMLYYKNSNSVSWRSVMFEIFYPEMFFFLQAGEDVAKKVMETQGGQCLET